MEFLIKPYTAKEIKAKTDSDGYITGDVVVSLDDLMELDFERCLDLLSEKLVGDDLLSDIGYEAVGMVQGDVIVRVTGVPEGLGDEEDNEDEN